MWPSKNKLNDKEQLELKGEFLRTTYLEKEFIVPAHIAESLTASADILTDTVPGFKGIVNVGGTSNGSYELRRSLNPKAPTDLDFYTVGDDRTLPYLDSIADTMQDTLDASSTKIVLDGVLNGKNPENFLNMDHLDEIAARGDTYLLALPFQSFFGDADTTKEEVLKFVIAQPNKQELWDEIASYHIQSLSMHHGSWPQHFSDTVMDDFYPQKVEKFELPVTPEEYSLTGSY